MWVGPSLLHVQSGFQSARNSTSELTETNEMFSLGAAASSTVTSDGSEDTSGPSTSSNMGKQETDSRDDAWETWDLIGEAMNGMLLLRTFRVSFQAFSAFYSPFNALHVLLPLDNVR